MSRATMHVNQLTFREAKQNHGATQLLSELRNPLPTEICSCVSVSEAVTSWGVGLSTGLRSHRAFDVISGAVNRVWQWYRSPAHHMWKD